MKLEASQLMQSLRQFLEFPRRNLLGLAAAGSVSSMLTSCAFPRRGPTVPTAMAARATVLGVPNERFYMVPDARPLEAEFISAMTRRFGPRVRSSGTSFPPVDLLAVSGGGEDGAFGAGLLCGWSERGTRPVFELVTGISTGALTAPFAFLGSSYDPQLRAVYTQLSSDRVLRKRYLTAALWDDALADNSPLFQTISSYLNEAMLTAIAAAYDEGRLLIIGTSNLDAQLPVMWNIGAIAKSGHPKSLDTVRRVLLASAAIPGAFPPTMFDVTVDGRSYQELHVDGGAFVQAFLYPSSAMRGRQERLRRGQSIIPATAYIIRNGRLHPNWETVERRTMGIVGRAISTMIMAGGYNDVQRIYVNTQRDHIDFNLAYIGDEFTTELPAPFDPRYMRALFEYGYVRGNRGYDWAKKPPNE